ncbi:DinB/UmuC family translesion DNA polymerase [Streptomyces viridochromogenes]|uniref:DNA polymerase Y-family little finger domain-containing protein n=1 Tax=Streptomyces viridochromogenes Tue57 TaxID=1160705 RepID=L8P4X3_STRVR|nr:hypothetical protein [Streptomyces viridochromogenes]ELS50362.1 hypothetical protein STVIR_8736 [Streptomyces viridochromogenes Tue57]
MSVCSPPPHPPPSSLLRPCRPHRRRPAPRHRPAPCRAPHPAVAATVRCAFPRHTLDGADVRAALLDLVVRLGLLLRRRDQVARELTLKLTFAGGGSWEKTRRLGRAVRA